MGRTLPQPSGLEKLKQGLRAKQGLEPVKKPKREKEIAVYGKGLLLQDYSPNPKVSDAQKYFIDEMMKYKVGWQDGKWTIEYDVDTDKKEPPKTDAERWLDDYLKNN